MEAVAHARSSSECRVRHRHNLSEPGHGDLENLGTSRTNISVRRFLRLTSRGMICQSSKRLVALVGTGVQSSAEWPILRTDWGRSRARPRISKQDGRTAADRTWTRMDCNCWLHPCSFIGNGIGLPAAQVTARVGGGEDWDERSFPSDTHTQTPGLISSM